MSVLLPESFTTPRTEVGGVGINFAVGGDGPPVLLLHGYPQTHLIWHRVAPELARDHTVVLADLRGDGDSDKPAPDAANQVYSKRAMARGPRPRPASASSARPWCCGASAGSSGGTTTCSTCGGATPAT